MMSPPYLLAGVLWLLLAVFYQTEANDKVKCYVCSWNPKENRTDGEEWCTDNNFRAELANTMDCDRGCEHAEMYDNNGVMELFLRNCYSLNKTLEHGCHVQKFSHYKHRKCFCDSDYCNAALASKSSIAFIAFLSFCAFFQYHLSNLERLF